MEIAQVAIMQMPIWVTVVVVLVLNQLNVILLDLMPVKVPAIDEKQPMVDCLVVAAN